MSVSSRVSSIPEITSKPESTDRSLAPVLEVNEVSEVFERPIEEYSVEEISPRIFTKKEVLDGCTIDGLNNAIYELGVVILCWPEIEEPVFETRTCFPPSYYTNSKKERLLLAYAENFRRQYHFRYKMRLPLLLQAPNECGLQKMVCTTIRPTKLTFADTNNWQGVAHLVSDFFNYEPLTKPMLHPERIMSPYTAIIRRSGNPFELAHICVSWLIGANYDAFVVVGTATRDTCMAIRYRTVCPDLPDENVVVEEEPPPAEEPRYRLVPLPDMTSKYVLTMEQRAADERKEAQDKIEAERQKKISELEAPPPDPIDAWRIHAWVLVLPGPMGIQEPFFIEPSEGVSHPLNSPKYKRLDSIYSHENYYVNLQDCSVGLDNISYDLIDLNCWEHLLAGEPFSRRQTQGADYTDKTTSVETDKHLDMPASWVEKLEVTADEKARIYPGSHKVIHYKKVLLDKFAPYSERDGIVKRIRIYDDYALTKLLCTYEYYENRVDLMETIKIDHVNGVTIETFKTGRRDHLIKHTYATASPSTTLEAVRTLEFNYYARLDHLTKIQCTDTTFDEYYTDREDKLESCLTIYTEGTKAEPNRQLHTITETYSRNTELPAKDDVWKRIFRIQDNSIELLYHYAYNFVTNDTRQYIKPNLAETGGKILYYPDKTSGYIADPVAMEPRHLNIYMGLCDNMEWEHGLTKHIRDRETDIHEYLRQRHREITEPLLYVSLFVTERNEAAKKGWKEQELAKAEMSEREKEAEIDPLAPYLARMFGSGHGTGKPLSYKEALLIREQCINDYKAKQLARQNLVMDRFGKLNEEYKAKKLWYLANQFILKPAQETAYFVSSAKMAFDVHNLEIRLTRSKDLSAPKFKALEDYLDRHPLLKELKRKAYYRK